MCVCKCGVSMLSSCEVVTSRLFMQIKKFNQAFAIEEILLRVVKGINLNFVCEICPTSTHIHTYTYTSTCAIPRKFS